MRALSLIFASLLAAAVAGCSDLQMLNDVTPDSGYAVAPNLVYDAPNALALDVYKPSAAANAPVVVFFGSRYWRAGNRQDYKFIGQALAARGFVAVIPDLRPYPQVKFPAFLYDAARAVRWARANISGYGGAPDKIVLMGHDAGAYDAAMLALDPEFLHKLGGDRSWIRGMIGSAGYYDFLPLNDPELRDLFGPPESFDKTQPVLYVDGGNPPLLLMYGEKDDIVPPQNSISLYDRVIRAGGDATKVNFPELNHKWMLDDLSERFQGNANLMNRVEEFVKRVTTGAPQAPPSGIQTLAPK